MKRSETVKFPNSVQLFKFCQKVMTHQRGDKKINDQEIGNILEYNPSDCSHWKRGEKSVRSVFSLARLAETLNVAPALIHDIATGASSLDDAFFEYIESNSVRGILEKSAEVGVEAMSAARARVEAFVTSLHAQSQFTTAPLYLPEVVRFFSYIQMQPIDMIDRLSRVLRSRPGHYIINYRKGDLKSQTRMSVLKDLGRIVLEVERARYPELGPANEKLTAYEQLIFVSSLLAPKNMVRDELSRLDSRRNVVADLAALFWIPKSLLTFQLQSLILGNSSDAGTTAPVVRAVSVKATTEPVSFAS
jgi:hypothetical protein